MITVAYNAEPGDKFEAYVAGKDKRPYAVVKIRTTDGLDPITIFTDDGINRATDYLRELRDVLSGAIAEMEEMGAAKEAE